MQSVLRKDGGNNVMGYDNPKIEELFDQGKATLDQAARKPIYSEIIKIMLEDMPLVKLQTVEVVWAGNHKVSGTADLAEGTAELPRLHLRSQRLDLVVVDATAVVLDRQVFPATPSSVAGGSGALRRTPPPGVSSRAEGEGSRLPGVSLHGAEMPTLHAASTPQAESPKPRCFTSFCMTPPLCRRSQPEMMTEWVSSCSSLFLDRIGVR